MRKLQLGVFQVDRRWKFYAEGADAITCPDRRSAVAAGEHAARAAMAHGRDVVLHLQDATGEFRVADLTGLSH